MKRNSLPFFFMLLVFMGKAKSGWSITGVALIYHDTKDVISGRYVLGQVTPGGVLVRPEDLPPVVFLPPQERSQDLAQFPHIVAGPLGEPLRYGTLVRFDNELHLALLKLGEILEGSEIQKRHLERSEAIQKFLPLAPTPNPPPPLEPFVIRMNGLSLSDEPLPLSVKNNQSIVNLDVDRVMDRGVWHISITLKSDPDLFFWKKGKPKGLNDAPSHVFVYEQQFVLIPFSPKKTLSIPIEVSSIAQDSYVWTVTVSAKKEKVEKKINIKIRK